MTQKSVEEIIASSENHLRTDVVLIDASVSQQDALVAGIPDDAAIIYLEPGATLEDVASVVADYKNIDGLHIVSHGGEGSLNLSGETINAGNLEGHSEALATIGRAMSADADILLYGCNIGSSGVGAAFISDFATYTNADVAASDDITGSQALGGDWELEIHSGDIETGVIISQAAQITYEAVLPTFDFEAGTVDNGTNIAQTISGVTVTISNTGGGVDVVAGGGFAGSSGNVAFIAAGTTTATTITFSAAVDITSIHVADGAGGINSKTIDFIVTDGSGNSTVQQSAGNHVSGSAVTLNWTGVTSFTIDANDSTQTQPLFDNIIFTVTPTNTAPDLGGTPADDGATEDVVSAIDLSAYNISDADGDTITITLAVNTGTLSSSDGNGTTAGVTVANSGTASMTLQGTAANLNTYLNDTSKIRFTSSLNSTSTATLTVTPNDGTVNGTADTVNITVAAVNDNPTGSGIPANITVVEDTASNVDFSAISFSDVDSSSITVTLTLSAGTFSTPADGAGVGGGVIETLVNPTQITLVGAPADISTYLDTASNIRYTGASNVSGNNVATISVTANDGDGSGNVALGTVNVNITAVNDNPSQSGLPTDITVVEDTASNVDFSAVSFADVDSSSITVRLTLSSGTFSTPADGAGVGGGVIETLVSSTVITLAGAPADINTYLDTASNIRYTGAANVEGNDAATITVSANDGDGSGDVAMGTVNIDITGTNDAPTASGIPTDVTVTENTASNVDLSAVTFSDVDGDSLTVTLTATAGTFTASSGGGVTVGGSGTGTLTLAGTTANISTYLDTVTNVQYTGASNVSGEDAASFTIRANDGTVNPTLGTVNIDITAVNDNPSQSGLPTDITVVEDTASNVDLSAVSFADADSSSITVRLTLSSGTFSTPADGAGVGGGVTETLVSSTVITLAGAPADINTYLDTASNIRYTGAANVEGNDAATITVTANDGDGSGDVAMGTVNIDITGANDAPTASGIPSVVTVTEDTASNVDLSGVSFTDVDGDSLTVTLAADAGVFTATSGGSVTVGGSGTATLTLAGTAANISTYLDTVTNVKYTGASNVSGDGAASFTIQANDGTVNPTLGTVNLNVSAINDNPTITSNGGGATASVSVAEGQTSVTTVAASDVDGDGLTYSISGGADQAQFVINSTTGALSFVASTDHENPTDVGLNNVYDVQVRVTDDGTGLLTDVQDIAVTVTNVNEAPTIGSNGGDGTASIAINENSKEVTTVQASPSASVSYSISGGADAALFRINSATGELSFARAPDFETPLDSDADNIYEVQVTATANSGERLSVSQMIAVTVGDLEERTSNVNDGVVVQTVSNTEGYLTTTIPIVEAAREEDPQTEYRNLADVVLSENEGGDPLLSVSLPVGVGLTSFGWMNTQTTEQASSDLINSIDLLTEGLEQLRMMSEARDYLNGLNDTDELLVRTLTLQIQDGVVPSAPIIITGNAGRQEALVVDLSALPKGTVVQLDDVDFVSFVGGAVIRGGAGSNNAVGDDARQFIVLGADDDTLYGGGGDDTVGSLGGDDWADGGDGDDIVFGGAGHDVLMGGSGNNALNGGFGFDQAMLSGDQSDYDITVDSDHHVIFTHRTSGDTTDMVDVERVVFGDQTSLFIAHSEVEAVGQHLLSEWLDMELNAELVTHLQSQQWQQASVDDVVNAFLKLEDAEGFVGRSAEELLQNFAADTDILQVYTSRSETGGAEDSADFIDWGVALEVDGGEGFDAFRLQGSESDFDIASLGDQLQITRYYDGAMINLQNAEMIDFYYGGGIAVAHNEVELILGRLAHVFLGRGATADEWKAGTDLLQDGSTHHQFILDWLENQAGFATSDAENNIIEMYQNAFGRNPTEVELENDLGRLNEGDLSYGWLGVEMVTSDEAGTTFDGVLAFYDWV